MTLAAALERYPGAETYTFGDSAFLCAQLLARVRSGLKTATCGALRDFADGGEPWPKVGRCDISLNWDGTPALVTRTMDLTQKRFCDVDADFALAEGENDTLVGWRQDHEAYFGRTGGFHPEMMLLCERFELVQDLATDTAGDR
ncbi:MAG: ASCH domain-containing protein [Pseudomonadota bacterium]